MHLELAMTRQNACEYSEKISAKVGADSRSFLIEVSEEKLGLPHLRMSEYLRDNTTKRFRTDKL